MLLHRATSTRRHVYHDAERRVSLLIAPFNALYWSFLTLIRSRYLITSAGKRRQKPSAGEPGSRVCSLWVKGSVEDRRCDFVKTSRCPTPLLIARAPQEFPVGGVCRTAPNDEGLTQPARYA